VPVPDIAAALATVRIPPGRGETLARGDLVVINDAYNANPASVVAALDTAAAMRGSKPLVVILGTMLELGPTSDRLHADVADRVVAMQPDLVAVTGEYIPAFTAHAATLGDRLITGPDPATLGERVAARLRGDELILLKASRGVRLEQAIPFLLPEA
jgi:UDP-N-acetylmuramoyl-tripeptide--D-alanyl-D-alanine ligase